MALFWVVVAIGVPIGWVKAMDLQIAATNRRQAEVRATANSYLTPDSVQRTPDTWDLAITKAWADHPTQTAQAATPTAKPTATATPTAKPTATVEPQKVKGNFINGGYGVPPIDLFVYHGGETWADAGAWPGETTTLKISYYWPPYGGINAGADPDHMASGKNWADWIGRAAACPAEWPLGTELLIYGHVWVCWDRGGAIVKESGYAWVDLLTPVMPYGLQFGSEISGKVRLP